MLRVISLGAGVQSTTMALMAAHGLINGGERDHPQRTVTPDCAIFADTGWEPRAVYEHLNWLEGVLPFPVYRVTAGNLRDRVLAGGFNPVPYFTAKGIGMRQCTNQYKLRPLYAKVRELLGGKTPKGGCEMWVGISRDEAQRMKPARLQYIVNRWPLIEAGMSRADCVRWTDDNGYRRAPRSACLGCGFRSDSEWRDVKAVPDEWADTVAVDRAMRNNSGKPQYMHASRKPLDDVDLTLDTRQIDMFNNECLGMCGV